MAPFIVAAIAFILLVVGGFFIVTTVLSGGSEFQMPAIPFFSTKTPTPTETPLPSETPTITLTPTITNTESPAATITPIPSETPSGPFTYTVQEGDMLMRIAEKFGLDLNYLIEYNKLPEPNIYVGQELVIPLGIEPPTATAVPTYLPKGRVIEIMVKPNDSFTSLAGEYNSTIEAILKENEDTYGKIDIKKDAIPALGVGVRLKIPVNLVTRTPTITPNISTRQTQTQAVIQTVMAQPPQ
jgi:LysM repeat protein